MTADAHIGRRLARWLGSVGANAVSGSRALGSDAVLLLEDRIMLDAEAGVAITAPVTTPLGGAFGITLTFDNVADADPGSSVGFAPYIDLILPATGKDGVGTGIDDGISFTSATFLGAAVKSTVLTFDATGRVTHPFAVDGTGAARIVLGTPGDQLVVLTLPFGSFTADQTPADIKVSLNLSPLADYDVNHLSDALQISARGGFALGRDPLNNPLVDPPVLQAVASTALVSPSLLTLTKVSSTPEGETATGPNFPRTYTIDLDVATGQTITSAHLKDLLPANIVYLGSTVTLGSGSLVTQPAIGSVVNPAANLLDYDFGSITGAAGVDARITVRFYVNDIAGGGGPVISPISGQPTQTFNDVLATGTFVPLDPRDAPTPFVEDRTAIDNTIINRSIAIQKSSVIAVDNNIPGLSPGDVLTYTLDIQLSDYFTAGDIVLGDLLADGQRLDTSFTPVFTVVERGITTGSLAFAGTLAAGGELIGGNFTSLYNPVSGATNLTIALSNEIDARNLFTDGDGILAGGRTRPGDAAALVAATTISVSFRAIVQNNFVAAQPLGQAVNQGDRIGDIARVDASVRDNATLAITGNVADTSVLSLPILGGSVQLKDIIAINNAAPVLVGGLPQLSQGDTVTFRLRYELPTTSVENFKLSDFLPLPVLPAAQLTRSAGAIGTTPGVNQWNYGVGDTFHTLINAPTPTATAPNVIGNAFTFDYGSYSLQNQPGGMPMASVVELVFTLRVADAPFGDGLLLTNQVTATEANAQGRTITTNAITQFQLSQPALTITKGVVDANGGNTVTFQGSRSPASVGFASAAGNAGAAAFTGSVTDAALATGPIDANLAGIDAGDKVTFAITVNNNGTGRNGAFDVAIKDTLPAGFAIPVDATGLNLKVTNGAGVAIAFTNVAAGAGLFGQGIILTDGVNGSLAADLDGVGAGTQTDDIVVITYDLVATTSVQPRQTWTNTATLTGYAALEGGNNFVTVAGGLTDAATVTTRVPTIAKVLTATDQGFTTGSTVAIGEIATFTITYTLTEGQTNNLILRDILPASGVGVLTPISATIVSVGSGITGPGVPIVGDGGILTGSTFNFTLGDVVVAGDNNQFNDTIVVEIKARVADDPLNARGDSLVNIGRLLYVTTTETGALVNNQVSDAASVRVVTPDLALAKTINVASADGGNAVIYTLALTNPATTNTTTAFDINLVDSDLVSLGFTNISIISIASPGAVNAAATDTGGTITITADSLASGGSITVSFSATVSDAVAAGSTLVNMARVTEYSTLPGLVPGERVITNEPTATASLPITGVTLVKDLITTSIGNDANPRVQIGETATFDITATLPEGSVLLSIADLLPIGSSVLDFVSATLFSIGGVTTPGATSGGALTNSSIGVGSAGLIDSAGTTATFNFGTITNTPDGTVGAGDRIVIRVVTRVPDVAANTAADNAVTNTATASFGTGTATATSSLDIVEPVITVQKTGPAGVVDAGARLSYSVVIRNTGDGIAYDLGVADPLAADLTLVPGSISFTGAVSGTAASFADIAIAALRPGETVTVTYQADVGDGVVLGSGIVNNVNINFDSVPGDAPGRALTPTSSATVPTGGPVTIDKVIVNTSVGNDTSADVVVGEVITYRLVTTLPDGTTTLNLTDTLPVGLDYVVGSARLVSFFGSSSAPLTITEGSTISFSFGAVTNPGDNAANPDNSVIVELQARVADIPSNQSGVVRTNNAVATTGLGSVTDATPPSVTITAPLLVIDKTTSIATAVPGDSVTYRVTLSHSAASTAAANDINLTDSLAGGSLTLTPGSLTIVSGPGTIVAGSTVNVSIPALALGQSTVIEYRAIVGAAAAGSTVANTAIAGFDSLPGPGGRPGSVADSVIIGIPDLDKIITGTSLADTGSAQFRPGNVDLAIGERLFYNLVVTLPTVGTQVRITDTLLGTGATGLLQLLGAPVITLGPGVTATIAAPLLVQADTNGDGVIDSLFWDFGTVTSTSPGGTITISVTAVTLDRADGAGRPGNSAGDLLALPASLDYGSGTDTASVSVDIVEPRVTLAKAVSPATGEAGTRFGYTVTLANAGSGPAYDLALSDVASAGLVPVGAATVTQGGVTTNFANANAVTLARLLPGETVTISYAARVADTVVVGTVLTNTASSGYDSLPGADPDQRVLAPVSGAVAVTFTPTTPATLLKSIIVAGTSDPNTGEAAVRPGITDLGIGEVATIVLTTTLPRGTSNNVTITDSLSVAEGLLGFDPATVSVTLGGVILAPGSYTVTIVDADGDGIADRVIFGFGAVTVPGDANPAAYPLVISYRATAIDVPANQNGDRLDLPASLGFATAAGNATLLTAIAGVDLVTPTLALSKGVVKTTADTGSLNGVNPPAGVLSGTAGDIFTYTLTIGHAAGSNAPAYDLALSDTLGAGLVLVAGSATTTLNGGGVAETATGLAVNGPTLLPGQSFIVTYQARIADSVVFGSVLPNSARLQYDAVSGAGGRAFAAAANASVTLLGSATVVKAVIATGNPLTGSEQFNPANPDVTVGETITYRIIVTLAEGTTPSLVITDRLPSGPDGVAEYLANARPVLGAGITAQFANPTPVLVDSDGDGRIDTIRWDFGRVTNAGNNRIDAGDTITIDVTGRLVDDARNTSGDTLSAPVRLDVAVAGGTITASANALVDVVEPRLVIDKAVAELSRFPGEIATYTLTLRHAAGSTAGAADITVRDLLTPDLTLVPGSLVIVSAPAGFAASVTGTSVSLAALPLGTELIYRFQAIVGFTVDTTRPLINLASVGYDSTPGPGGRAVSTSDSAALLVQAPGMMRRDEVLPGWRDDRYVDKLPRIDQIYSGAAQPGSRVTLTVSDARGAPSGVANVTADSGGNWLALMPSVTASDLMRTDHRNAWFERSALFSGAANQDRVLADGTGDRLFTVTSGASFADAPYALRIEQSPAGFAADDAAAANLRSYFAPAWRAQLFADQPLSADTVFRDVAGTAVSRDFAADLHPLGFGVNAFNAEFLASAALGSTR